MFDLNLLIGIAVVAVFLFIILKFFRGMTVNVYKRREMEKLDPTTTGERLKKYIIQASKMNPRTAKIINLERTAYSEGGRIGKVVGHISDKDTTSFIIKKHFIGRKYLLYCPVDMHTSLHQKNVLIHGVSIHSAGGYLWPTPSGTRPANAVFMIVASAFEKDLKRMLTMDVPQIEVEQIYEGITGFKRDRAFYEEPEDIDERYVEMSGDESEEP